MKLKKNSNPFTQIPNELIISSLISSKSKGIYCFMATKPNNYHFTILSLSKQIKEGPDSIRVGLQELREFGWVTFYRDENGKGVYMLHWTVTTTTTARVENPSVENPLVGKSTRINKIIPLINNINNNTENPYEELRSYFPNGGFTPGEMVKSRFYSLTPAQRQQVLLIAKAQMERGGSQTYSALLISQVEGGIVSGEAPTGRQWN